MHPNYTAKEVLLAKQILLYLRSGNLNWPGIKYFESLFFLDAQNDFWWDISETRFKNKVTVNWDLYDTLKVKEHITIHNHPGKSQIAPSDGDWLYAKYIDNFYDCNCLFHLITSPNFSRLCMFQCGKGVLHIFHT